MTLLLAVVLVALAVSAYVLVVVGSLTLDTGIGRRTRPLGPLSVTVAAPREAVFDFLAAPYLSPNPPRAQREKVEVLERGVDLVVASHRTPVAFVTTVTVEAVGFDRPGTITFRLLRGPVPFVVEEFRLSAGDAGTTLEYTGTLGTDFWLLGRLWGAVVARIWERTVAGTLTAMKRSVEELEERRNGRSEAPAEARAARS